MAKETGSRNRWCACRKRRRSLPLATRVPAACRRWTVIPSKATATPDGTVGTKNLLAITTSVQCVAGVVDYVVKRIKAELLPKYPNVDGVIGLNHIYGCGVAINAPAAVVPIRTLHNLTLNPNFGNEVMIVSLGCGADAGAPAQRRRSTRHSDQGRQRRHHLPAGRKVHRFRWSSIIAQAEKYPGQAQPAPARNLSGVLIWSSACNVAAVTPSPA